MIIFPIKNLVWDSSDAKVLRDFFEAPVGQKILQFLSGRIPELLCGEDVNKTLVRSGEVKGAQDIFNSLVSLIVEPPAELEPEKKTTENYPDLADESAWEDSKT